MNKIDKNVKQHELLSLKEAAEITGYSSDYIGQLIRNGKIAGRQVYCNVAWMTTVKSVMDYKEANKKTQTGFFYKIKKNLRMIGMEINAMKLFIQTFKTILPMVFIIFMIFFAMIFLFAFNLNSSETKAAPVLKPVENRLEY